MSPLAWLAIPVLATIAAAIIVPIGMRRRSVGLTPAERSLRLQRALAPRPNNSRRGQR